MTQQEILSVIRQLKFRDWAFEIHWAGPPLLRVVFNAPCNDTGESKKHAGRWWRLEPDMTRDEIVQTAFKAVLTAVEHETREQFLYRDQPVFGPHMRVERLWEAALLHRGP